MQWAAYPPKFARCPSTLGVCEPLVAVQSRQPLQLLEVARRHVDHRHQLVDPRYRQSDQLIDIVPLQPCSVLENVCESAAMSPQPLPFGGGITFQCDGKQVSLTASVCSTGALEATLDQSGNPVGAYTTLDASAIEKLGMGDLQSVGSPLPVLWIAHLGAVS